MWTLVTLGLLLVFANFEKRSMQFKQTLLHLKQPSTIATVLLNNKSHKNVLLLAISWYCLSKLSFHIHFLSWFYILYYLDVMKWIRLWNGIDVSSLNACFKLKQIIKKSRLFIMIFLCDVFCLSSFRIELTVDSRYLFIAYWFDLITPAG